MIKKITSADTSSASGHVDPFGGMQITTVSSKNNKIEHTHIKTNFLPNKPKTIKITPKK